MKNIDDIIEVQFRFYKTFYSISLDNYQQIKKICLVRDKKKVKTDNDVDFICKCNAQIQKLAVTTVVFSCMCLESYINCYGISNFSKTYFENYLDKLDLKSKWIIIPKLVMGKQLKTDSSSYRKMIDLIKLRNRLVHDKPITKKVSEIKDTDWVTEQDAKKSIETVKEFAIELKKIDNKNDIDWLTEIEIDPYT